MDILRELQFMLANERLLIELYISVKNNKTGNIDLEPKMLWREEKGSLLEMSCLAFFGRVPKETRLISELTCLSLPLTEDRKLSCVLVISLMASHKSPKTEITAGSLVVTEISERQSCHTESLPWRCRQWPPPQQRWGR